MSQLRYQFGPFQFDPARGELTSADRVAPLSPEAAQVLRLLLEQAGTVVTRGELKDGVWGDAPAEFDRGLPTAIRQLRAALHDDVGRARIIESASRGGYRCIARVTIGTPQDIPRASAGGLASLIPGAMAAAPARPPLRQRLLRGTLRVSIAVATIVVLAFAALRTYRAAVAPPATATAFTLAILPFDVDDSIPVLRDLRTFLLDSITAGLAFSAGSAGGGTHIVGGAATAHYRGTTTPPQVLASDVGATHVLKGALRLHDPAISAYVQLIRIADGQQLWFESVEISPLERTRWRAIAADIADSALVHLRGG
jgi:DNA-binding winged helix-turn-helix (wHTH) protein/TolB-like protein